MKNLFLLLLIPMAVHSTEKTHLILETNARLTIDYMSASELIKYNHIILYATDKKINEMMRQSHASNKQLFDEHYAEKEIELKDDGTVNISASGKKIGETGVYNKLKNVRHLVIYLID